MTDITDALLAKLNDEKFEDNAVKMKYKWTVRDKMVEIVGEKMAKIALRATHLAYCVKTGVYSVRWRIVQMEVTGDVKYF